MNMGVETTFRETESVGEIHVTYEVGENAVDVRVDSSRINGESRKRVFVLNEQSAMFFRKYSDSNGTTLVDDQIGAWNGIEADHASLMDIKGQFGFRVWRVAGAVLRHGRETMRNCLDWVGLDYEVNPNVDVFEYRIGLLGAK
jgi:hypothetical protein